MDTGHAYRTTVGRRHELRWHAYRWTARTFWLEAKVTQLYQCRLRKGTLEQTAWIEKRGAKLGATVELLPSHEMWEVTAVFTSNAMLEETLREVQHLNRNSLPSVKGMQ